MCMGNFACVSAERVCGCVWNFEWKGCWYVCYTTHKVAVVEYH